jgi:hypothetical protein
MALMSLQDMQEFLKNLIINVAQAKLVDERS